MLWNWQQKDWPNFSYKRDVLAKLEAQFLHESGILIGAQQHFREHEQHTLMVELMGEEALKTSEIEGEYLNRDSLQSSIRRHFGLQTDHRKIPPAERGIAEMMVDCYRHFNRPLSHEQLFSWHLMLMNGRWDVVDLGQYRTHVEPMQVVSGAIGRAKVHFEAPPSHHVQSEMDQFISWFNRTAPDGLEPLPFLTRAGITHLYFESIHPFEDGNGRIGRALVEKALSQGLKRPTLIALSCIIQRHKKAYYHHLGESSQTLDIDSWLDYFAQTILDAQNETVVMVQFLIQKMHFYDRYAKELNERQAKVIARLFEAGPRGFEGGLSAENYIRITQASRATATRDLQALVSLGVLVQSGQLKSTRYAFGDLWRLTSMRP